MRPAVGAPAREYIRTGVVQKPVLRVTQIRYATLWRFLRTSRKSRKIQEIL